MVVLGRRVNLIPVTSFWPEVQIAESVGHQIKEVLHNKTIVKLL